MKRLLFLLILSGCATCPDKSCPKGAGHRYVGDHSISPRSPVMAFWDYAQGDDFPIYPAVRGRSWNEGVTPQPLTAKRMARYGMAINYPVFGPMPAPGLQNSRAEIDNTLSLSGSPTTSLPPGR